MTHAELYKLIELQPQMIEGLEKAAQLVSTADYEQYIDGLMESADFDNFVALAKALAPDEGNMKMMYLQMEAAVRDHSRYEEKGISDKIYADTFACFTRFAGECLVRNGSYFFDRSWWTYRQTSMTLFRLGELEFELTEFEKEKIISVHIPSNAKLADELIDSSFASAKEFVSRFYPEYEGRRFFCESWLLAPALKELLPEGSNILRFQSRFNIVKTEEDAKDYLEWVFKTGEDTKAEDLAENTSLQRNMKAHLLAGKKVGVGIGFINF